MAICYLCQRHASKDQWCVGCRHYICQDCDTFNPLGPHKAEDHNDIRNWNETGDENENGE